MTGLTTPADWAERYARPGYAFGQEPNVFLTRSVHHLRPGGRVLVPADGEGRNGVWLAQQGFHVTTVDMSPTGCDKARLLAAERGVMLDIICADLATWTWPRAAFDAVVSIFLHLAPDLRPTLHTSMRDALLPGGAIVIEAFNPAHLPLRAKQPSVGGPGDASLLFTEAMLRADFAPLQPILAETAEVELREGLFHNGRGAVVRAVFTDRP